MRTLHQVMAVEQYDVPPTLSEINAAHVAAVGENLKRLGIRRVKATDTTSDPPPIGPAALAAWHGQRAEELRQQIEGVGDGSAVPATVYDEFLEHLEKSQA